MVWGFRSLWSGGGVEITVVWGFRSLWSGGLDRCGLGGLDRCGLGV